MKRLLTFFTLILSVTLVMGQELTVKNFALDPTDLTASTQRRNDNNGDACALIKVQLARPGAEFLGNVMGDTPYNKSEYFVYMMKGSKMLQVKLEGYIPVKINFTDYGYSSLESLSTYVLSITLPTVPGHIDDDGKTYFSLTVVPSTATVFIDDDANPIPLDENGSLMQRLERGSHRYRVIAGGYETRTENFTLGQERVTKEVKLVSLNATLTVNCQTPAVDIYINEKRYNTNGSSWTGMLSPGSYIIEARKEGYYTQKQSVELVAKQSLTIEIPALIARVGQLDVSFSPPNSEVWIDGKRTGLSPDLFKNLTVGSHKVEIRKEGYQSETRTVTIAEGQTASLSGSLAVMTSSASSLDAEAMYNMGNDYYYGRNGKTKDYAEAVKWYRKAAEQGDASGQYSLGYMYRHGYGVSQNYAEAFKWYGKSAEQGDASGQNGLGFMYAEGLGVAKDYAEAVKWYRKAAEQGYAVGQYNLGLNYYNGTGVTKDLNEAKIWFQKAAAQGYEKAKNMLEKL